MRIQAALCDRRCTAAVFIGLLLLVAVTGQTVRADLYWDKNGSTPGAGGSTPTGTWGVDSYWSTSAAGNVATGAWTPGETAVFSAGSDATGSFTVTVSGTQSIGGLRFEEGTVILSGGIFAISGNTTFTQASGGDRHINCPVQGNGVLKLAGSGQYPRLNAVISDSGGSLSIRLEGASWIFNAQHTYSGGTTVTGGQAIPLVDSTGPAGAPTSGPFGQGTLVLQGGALRPGAGSGGIIANPVTLDGNFTFGTSDSSRLIYFTGPVTLTGDRTLTFAGNSATRIDGVIGESGGNFGFTKAGSQTLTLTASNTYSGQTNINAGVVNIQNANALGSTAAGTVVANGAALQLQGGIAVGNEALTIAGHGISNTGALRNLSGNNSWAGPISMSSGVQSRIHSDSGTLTLSGGITSLGGNTLILGGSGNGEVSGPISNVYSLTKEGTGTWILSGANTYTTSTNVNAGALNIRNAAALGSTAAGTTVADNARLELQGGITVSGEPITISGNGGNYIGALQSANGVNTWDGPVTLGANASRIGANGPGATLIVAGPIDDGPNTFDLGIRNADTGGLTVLTGQSTYGGRTWMVVGTVKIDGGDDRLPTSTTVQLGANGNTVATFDLNGRNQTIGGLELLGAATCAVTNTGASPSTLTVNNTSDFSFGGRLTNAAQPLHLVKSGSATLTLTAANTYTGNTTVSAGTLALSGAGSIAQSPRIDVASGATLNVSGVTGGFTLLASQTLQGRGTVVGPITINGTHAPGTSIGVMTMLGDYTLAAPGTLQIELGGTAGPGIDPNGHDQLVVQNGLVSLAGTLDLSLLFAPSLASQFVIIDNDGTDSITGTFAGLPEGAILKASFGGFDYPFVITYQGYTGNDVVLTAVPEPAGWALLLALTAGAATVFARRSGQRNRGADQAGQTPDCGAGRFFSAPQSRLLDSLG